MNKVFCIPLFLLKPEGEGNSFNIILFNELRNTFLHFSFNSEHPFKEGRGRDKAIFNLLGGPKDRHTDRITDIQDTPFFLFPELPK